MDMGIYSLNACRYLTGEEPKILSASSSTIDKTVASIPWKRVWHGQCRFPQVSPLLASRPMARPWMVITGCKDLVDMACPRKTLPIEAGVLS